MENTDPLQNIPQDFFMTAVDKLQIETSMKEIIKDMVVQLVGTDKSKPVNKKTVTDNLRLFGIEESVLKQIDGISNDNDQLVKFVKKVKSLDNNWKAVLDEIKALMKNYQPQISIPQTSIGGGSGGFIPQVSSGTVDLKWDTSKIGHLIQVSNGGKSVYLKENAYMFRTAITSEPMMGGVHYWEIHADSRTENELKIGVTMKNQFHYDTSFSDYEFGFAYYGLGQLRHGSNSIGAPYGKKFKNSGVLGCCLDMNNGTLSFGMNGEFWGIAYKSDTLKKGPAYVAVSLLHHAGCTIVSGKPVPSYFKI